MVARVVLSQEPLQLSRLIQMSLISLILICKWMGKRSLILPLRQFQRALRPWLKKKVNLITSFFIKLTFVFWILWLRKYDVSRDKFLANMMSYGNTSAASIPILLSENVANGTLKLDSGQTILLSGFGGGLTWGSLIVKI